MLSMACVLVDARAVYSAKDQPLDDIYFRTDVRRRLLEENNELRRTYACHEATGWKR